MAQTLEITDGTAFGETQHQLTLVGLEERLTVRELIRARIYQEVADYNQQRPELFQGLVQPEHFERQVNGFRPKRRKEIDWEAQFEKACEAFGANGFFILINDRQAESLEESFEVTPETEVSFVRLVPLVGG